ncbi:MAG: nucleoside phosphorylase [Terracidiphilus sp.]
MRRVAVIAAMVGELKPLVRGWRRERRAGVEMWHWRFRDGQGRRGEWVAAAAGAGAEAAMRALVAAEQALAEGEEGGPVEAVISVGWAGALRRERRAGEAYRVTGVIDARTGERFEAAAVAGMEECRLVTSARVADAAEKRRLGVSYRADLVDMEAAPMARMAGMRGARFHCCKGVSDGYNEQLPDFNRFLSSDGQFHPIRLIFFVLFRPRYWQPLVRMGENSTRAARAMAECVLELLDGEGMIRNRNGYPAGKC